MQQGKKKMLLIILTGILVAVVAVGAVILVNGQMKEKSYKEAISNGEKYLADNNYEDAIVQYKKAISVNPKDEEAYLALADIYVEQEAPSKARSILKKGFELTGSAKIELMLNRLTNQTFETSDLVSKNVEDADIDLSTASANMGWNTSLMQKAEVFCFDDYKNEFGMVASAKMDDEGYLEVEHSGLDGICYYRNTNENKNIVDENRKLPAAEGMPEKISFHSLDSLFRNFEGGASLERLQMLIGERVEPQKAGDMTYIEAIMEDCIIRIETDENGNIISPNAWNEVVLLNANKIDTKAGTISGIVVDAVTGDGVNNAKITFKPKNTSLETETVTTSGDGTFSAELEADEYAVTVTASDYISEEFIFVMEEGKNYSGETFVISPKLASGSARIVLEWNAEPQDLDSYLIGETDSGTDVFVNWTQKQVKSDGNVIAELDLDDTNGYGPETITINDLNGVYQYTVVDYRVTYTLQQYGATVKVYLPGKAPETITIDPGAGVENVWNVCEIDHGELKILNSAPADDNLSEIDK